MTNSDDEYTKLVAHLHQTVPLGLIDIEPAPEADKWRFLLHLEVSSAYLGRLMRAIDREEKLAARRKP